MRFSKNEKVKFLNETGIGIVLSYKTKDTLIVLEDNGFECEKKEGELVKIVRENISISGISRIDKTATSAAKKEKKNLIGVTKYNHFWEVDLHSHQIMDSEKGKTSGEILNYQLQIFKNCFLHATEDRIRKLIVIHGVGKGTLKNEIRSFLDGKSGINFYDADYRDYGKGATEIRFFHSSKGKTW